MMPVFLQNINRRRVVLLAVVVLLLIGFFVSPLREAMLTNFFGSPSPTPVDDADWLPDAVVHDDQGGVLEMKFGN